MNLAQTIIRKLPTTRYPSTISKTLVCQKSTTNKAPSSSSSSSSSSDSDDDIKKKKLSSKEAAARLNTLLQEMVTTTSNHSFSGLKLAQPKNKRVEGKKEKQEQKETVTVEPVEKQVVNAVKNVAESLGGDTKQTESELLMKLLNPVENSSVSNTSLSDILKGMKIEREVKPPQQSRAEQVRTVLNKISSTPRVEQRQANQRRPRQQRTPMNIAQRLQIDGGTN